MPILILWLLLPAIAINIFVLIWLGLEKTPSTSPSRSTDPEDFVSFLKWLRGHDT